MKLEFTPEERIAIYLLFNDVISGAEKAQDKVSIKYAKKIQNQFDNNNSISYVKKLEILLISNIVSNSIKTLNKSKDKVQDIEIFNENLTILMKLKDKLDGFITISWFIKNNG